MFKSIWRAVLDFFGFHTPDNSSRTKLGPIQRTARHPGNSVQPPIPTAPVQPNVPAPTPVPKLYEGKAFSISENNKAQAWLYLKGQSGKRVGPTPSQQKVIFADDAANVVVAGAGSGKSTTLVNRVLFLHKVKKVPLNNMTVFTFTRKSRTDFVEKLVEEATQWELNLGKKQAEGIVLTFHAKALRIFRKYLGGKEVVFELLEKQFAPRNLSTKSTEPVIDSAESLSEEEEAANELELFSELDEKAEQAEILRDAYIRTYRSDPGFRQAIYTLFANTLITQQWQKDEKYQEFLAKIDWMSKVDDAFCSHVEAQWSVPKLWPIEGVQTRSAEGKRFELRVEGQRLFANGFIPELNLYVLLGFLPSLNNELTTVQGHKFRPLSFLHTKRRLLLAGCNSPIRFVKNEEDLAAVKMELQQLNSLKAHETPIVKIKLPGDISAVEAFTTLFQYGAFIESLGLLPNKFATYIQPEQLTICERAAVQAVTSFYSNFYEILKEKQLVTFNQIFSRLAKNQAYLERLGISALIGTKHLMIDEFQDISPLIVNFVLGIQSELARKTENSQRPSLMCVGDDWQSIYGWRGSSPQFLLEVEKYFEGAPKAPLMMTENFRSSRHIINCGESYIHMVRNKSNKQGVPCNSAVSDIPMPVMFVDGFKDADITRAVNLLLTHAGPTEKIYILAAKRKLLKPFSRIKDERLLKTTFHQSKGLEADFVILIGAPKFYGINNLKNQLYLRAGFTQTFDAAARDESFRIAYVAATRAKKMCIWYANSEAGSVMEEVPAGGGSKIAVSAAEIDKRVLNYFHYQSAQGKPVSQKSISVEANSINLIN